MTASVKAESELASLPYGRYDGEVDCKRFYLPAILRAHCAHCGNRITRDFRDSYLSYPKIGVPFATYVHCLECDADTQVKVVLRVALEVVESD